MRYEDTIMDRWAAEDPEFVKGIEDFRKQFEVAKAMTTRRLEMGLDRGQFAETLGVSLNELARLECGDFWESREDTERWINETLKMK
jgi:hypothetical protein